MAVGARHDKAGQAPAREFVAQRRNTWRDGCPVGSVRKCLESRTRHRRNLLTGARGGNGGRPYMDYAPRPKFDLGVIRPEIRL